MADIRAISADSHMTEPGDLWVKRLDRSIATSAASSQEGSQADPSIVAAFSSGLGIHPYGCGRLCRGRGGQELRDHMNHGYEAARPSGWDPVERLKDQDLDGVIAEVLVLHPRYRPLQVEGRELQTACLRVYNDWLAEFCSHSPKRLIGIGLYSLRQFARRIGN